MDTDMSRRRYASRFQLCTKNNTGPSYSLSKPNGSLYNRHRLIIDTPFAVRNIVSYGLIVYARDTGRWVIVQRKHSAEFLLFMRGFYRLTHLPLLLARITMIEAETIKKCLNEGPDTFKQVYLHDLGLSDDNLQYALIRMAESRKVTLNLLSKLDLSKNELSWTWPKGRLTYSPSEKETPFDCAKREFREEVEIELSAPLFISDTYVSEVFHTITGRNIESRYWVYIIPNEIPISPPIDNPEVGNRIWADTDECRKLVNQDELFNRIIDMIDSLQ